MLDDGPHLATRRCLSRPQHRNNWRAARHMVDVHGRKASFVFVRIPEGELLTAVSRAKCVIDVEDLLLPRLHGAAELIDKRRGQSSSFDFARGSRQSGIASARRPHMPTFLSACRSRRSPASEDWFPPSKSTVSFLRWSAGRSKGNTVASVMMAVARRNYAEHSSRQ